MVPATVVASSRAKERAARPSLTLTTNTQQMGGIVMTSDGNAILREIMVQHPAAKSMIEIARTQDEEVGDGTTSVIILAGEVLAAGTEFMEQKMHPTTVISAYLRCLDDALTIMDKELTRHVDIEDREQMVQIVESVVGTKILKKWSTLACNIALDAVGTVVTERNGRKEIDIKRYAKVEKIPGGELEDSRVLKGVMLQKDVVHAQMSRRIENPRILLLDCGLEYKKGESQTNVEFTKDSDFTRMLQLEEEHVKGLCADIIKWKPDLVFTEKGVSDLAQHFFVKAGITCIRRIRKSDNNRIARATGATIVNRPDEIKEADIGLECGLFEIRKVGDEYFTFLEECKAPKACTILLRGASKDILMEVERNLDDAMKAARNVIMDPRLVPGGGATETALATKLAEKAQTIEGVAQWPYRACANALEVIPRTLIQNCGANTIRTLTALRAKHTESTTWGIDGNKGEIANMTELGIWEPYLVKVQTIKTAIETAAMLLRIDKVVSGVKRPKGAQQQQAPPQAGGMGPGGMGAM